MTWVDHPDAERLKGIRERIKEPSGQARYEQPLSDDDLKVLAGAAVTLRSFAKEVDRERVDCVSLLDQIDKTRQEIRQRLGLDIRENQKPIEDTRPGEGGPT